MAILPKFARQSRAKDADIHEKPKPQKSKSNEMSDRTQLDHSGSDDLSQVSQSAKNEGLDEEEKQVNTAEDGVIVRLTKLKLSAVVIAYATIYYYPDKSMCLCLSLTSQTLPRHFLSSTSKSRVTLAAPPNIKHSIVSSMHSSDTLVFLIRTTL